MPPQSSPREAANRLFIQMPDCPSSPRDACFCLECLSRSVSQAAVRRQVSWVRRQGSCRQGEVILRSSLLRGNLLVVAGPVLPGGGSGSGSCSRRRPDRPLPEFSCP